jgi:hypothetical protein
VFQIGFPTFTNCPGFLFQFYLFFPRWKSDSGFISNWEKPVAVGHACSDSITVHHASIGWPGRRCHAIDLPCIRRRPTALFGPAANLTSSWVSIHHRYVLSPHRPLLTPLCCSACRSCCTAFLLGLPESQSSVTWVLSPPW